MTQKIVACGCSFTSGYVNTGKHSVPYPNLVGKSFNINVLNLASPSASNYYISKQIEFSIFADPCLVIIGLTTYLRFDFIKDDVLSRHPSFSDFQRGTIFSEDKILSRSFRWFIENSKNPEYSDKNQKDFKKISEFSTTYVNPYIKQDQDRLIILGSIYKLIEKNIPFVIVDFDNTFYSDNSDYVFKFNYSDLNKQYPVIGDIAHFNQDGHNFIADQLIAYLKNKNIIST
jgi:hypothetical protein